MGQLKRSVLKKNLWVNCRVAADNWPCFKGSYDQGMMRLCPALSSKDERRMNERWTKDERRMDEGSGIKNAWSI